MENNSAKYQMTGQSNQLTKQDVFDFLLNAYFGNVDDPFFVAVDSAYLDVNRTVEFKKSEMIITEENKNELRKQAVAMIKTEIQSVQRKTDVNQESFDMWHKNLCRAIVNIFFDAKVPFHYGQAQKWVNMSMKYLSVIDINSTAPVIRFMHIPIDSIVIDLAEDDFQVVRPTHRWSRMDEQEYLCYQSRLRDAIIHNIGLTPMLWEFRSWNR